MWKRGRNSTSVVLEVLPDKADATDLEGGMDEDEDVLELPIFVRERDRDRGEGVGWVERGDGTRFSPRAGIIACH